MGLIDKRFLSTGNNEKSTYPYNISKRNFTKIYALLRTAEEIFLPKWQILCAGEGIFLPKWQILCAGEGVFLPKCPLLHFVKTYIYK